MPRLRNVKKINIVRTPTGELYNEIETRNGYLIYLPSYNVDKLDEELEIIEAILYALENANITLDPSTGKITISFSKAKQ